MGYQSTILLAFLFITTASLAHGYSIGSLIAQLRVSGVLYCSVDTNNVNYGGALPGCPSLNGVNVTIACNGGTTNLGQALTDTSGFFRVVLNTADALLFDPSACRVTAQLPIVGCTVFPPTGILQAVPSLLSIVGGLLGSVVDFSCGTFSHL